MASNAGFRTDITSFTAEPGGLPRCMFVCCCFPCAFGDLVQQLDSSSGACCAGSYCGACCLFSILGTHCALGPCYHCNVRKAVRVQTGIAADENISECINVCCCGPCALCQELNHMELCKGDPPKINPVGMQAPYAQQQMAMAPPPQQMQAAPVINITVGAPPAQQYPQQGYPPQQQQGYPPPGGYAPPGTYGAPPPQGYPQY